MLLASCSSDGESGTESDLLSLPLLAVGGLAGRDAADIVNPWLASIVIFRQDSVTPGTGFASINTLQYGESNNVQNHIDWYSAQTTVDTCVNSDEMNMDDMTGTDDSNSPPFVSAGESVTINASNGTWFTLNEGDTGNYQVLNELPAAIPVGASVSIPGEVFPSVGAIPITEAPPVERIAPAFGPVSEDSEYLWQPVGGPGVFIELSFFERDNTGAFLGLPIVCFVEDDGEFELPEDALLTVSNTTNNLELYYSRDIRRIDVIEGVVAYTRVSVRE